MIRLKRRNPRYVFSGNYLPPMAGMPPSAPKALTGYPEAPFGGFASEPGAFRPMVRTLVSVHLIVVTHLPVEVSVGAL